MKPKFLYLTYIICIMLCLSVLFGTMFFTDSKLQNDVVTASDDDDYAKVLDNYISRNFGFRTPTISLFTKLKAGIFNSSAVDDVIIGENSYLYFKDTVPDFSGTNNFSDRELYNVNKTITLLSEAAQNEGCDFLFAIAPNKNSLYNYMPYNYLKSDSLSNAQRLMASLNNVNYVDLFALFNGFDDEMYFKTDSHWNDLGGYYVYEALQKGLDKPFINFAENGYTASKTMVGDLAQMLYPDSKPTEEKLSFKGEQSFTFLTKTRSYEQDYIETENPEGSGSLLMFRDSFSNNVIEHFSKTYKNAIYDKGVPYDLTQIQKYAADTVLVLIAERNVGEYINMAPVMQAPVREKIEGSEVNDLCKTVSAENHNGKLKFCGELSDKYTKYNTDIFVCANGKFYELTPKGENGFEGYILNAENCSEYSIIIKTENAVFQQTF